MKLSDLSVALVVISVGMLSCGGSSGPANNFGAQLSGANETPAISTAASGAGTIALNGTTVNYTVSGTGLSGNATGAHIHIGAVGVAGPVIVDFAAITPLPAGTSTSIAGSFTAANIKNPTNPPLNPPVVTLDDLMAQIRAGNAYVNIHTAAHSGGEIRGQLTPQ
jgi:hypothetical protein